VTDVPEGPAMDGGMKSGDVILSFDGKDVEDTRGLVRRVGNAEVGKAVRVVVFRDGKTTTLKVTLGRREEAEGTVPAAQMQDAEDPAPVERDVLGLTLSEMSDELRQQLDLKPEANGLVVRDVDPESEAYEKGLRGGDVITEAGQQSLATVEDFETRIEDAKEAGRKSLLLLVRRSGEPRFVALSLDDE
ncbi:MAG TPA: serine protease, partial [Roseovarius nubinhibens]|nr:serine protease [Roseovarius nubinhibens]